MSLGEFRTSSHRRFHSLYATPVKKLLLSREELVLKDEAGIEDETEIADSGSLH